MSNITNISATAQTTQAYENASVTKTEKDGETTVNATYESYQESTSVSIELSGTGSLLDTYKTDTGKIEAMKADFGKHVDALKQMVMKLLDTQSGVNSVANGNLHDLIGRITGSGGIDELSQKEAQSLISEDGYWGVNQTSQRILDFAKALSGGDPDKIEMLRAAVEKGFEQAESAWGGELPGISYETREKIMAGFDEWANEGKETEEPEGVTDTTGTEA